MIMTFCSLGAQAKDDFGIWTELGATKVLPYNMSVFFEGEFRSMNNTANVDRWGGSLGVGYKPYRFLKFAASYSFLYEFNSTSRKEHYKDDTGLDRDWNGYNETQYYWTPKNRFNGEFTLDYKFFGFLKVSLRERYQYTHQKRQMVPRAKYRYKSDKETLKPGYPIMDEPNEKEEKTKQYLRSRLKLDFDKKGWAFTPFVSFEIYNNLDNELILDKTRVMVGTEYKINQKNEMSVAYGFSNDVEENPYEGKHLLSIGYAFKF